MTTAYTETTAQEWIRAVLDDCAAAITAKDARRRCPITRPPSGAACTAADLSKLIRERT